MASICEINGQKATIEYPCTWEYKIIVLKDDDINKIAKEILLQKEYKIVPSNKSKSGKYKSYNLTTLVESEDERRVIFQTLKQNNKVKYIL